MIVEHVSCRRFEISTGSLLISPSGRLVTPAVKAELYSTWLAAVAGIYLIDPISLEKQVLDGLAV
jgi:hypothetical protein